MLIGASVIFVCDCSCRCHRLSALLCYAVALLLVVADCRCIVPLLLQLLLCHCAVELPSVRPGCRNFGSRLSVGYVTHPKLLSDLLVLHLPSVLKAIGQSIPAKQEYRFESLLHKYKKIILTPLQTLCLPENKNEGQREFYSPLK